MNPAQWDEADLWAFSVLREMMLTLVFSAVYSP